MHPKTSTTRAMGLPSSSPAPRSPQPHDHHQVCSGMHTGHWRGQGEGHPAALGVPAPGGESPGCQRITAASQKSAGVGRVGIGPLFLPPTPLAPTLLPRRGAGTAGALLGHPSTQPGCPLLSGLPFPARDGPGVPRGLQSIPPMQERWEQLPWEVTQAPSPPVGTRCPSPAETPDSSH